MKEFQVLCIRKEEWRKTPAEQQKPSPAYLSVSTVIDQKEVIHFDADGNRVVPGLYYKLKEFGNSGFHASQFIRLPEPDADEMQEEVREAIVNLETQPA